MLALRALARPATINIDASRIRTGLAHGSAYSPGVALLPLLVVAGWRIRLLTVVCSADACQGSCYGALH